jgi:transcription-repair coupling factor (superfamily II helicase)
MAVDVNRLTYEELKYKFEKANEKRKKDAFLFYALFNILENSIDEMKAELDKAVNMRHAKNDQQKKYTAAIEQLNRKVSVLQNESKNQQERIVELFTENNLQTKRSEDLQNIAAHHQNACMELQNSLEFRFGKRAVATLKNPLKIFLWPVWIWKLKRERKALKTAEATV